jgi:hypothetical protein
MNVILSSILFKNILFGDRLTAQGQTTGNHKNSVPSFSSSIFRAFDIYSKAFL